MSTEAKHAKKALRRETSAKLVGLSEDDLAVQSLKAQQLIVSLPRYQQASRISVYLSMPTGEARTDLILHDALRHGKKVFVPHVYSVLGENGKKRRVMDMLRLESREELDALERDSWGIPSLSPSNLSDRENAIGGSGLAFATDGIERREPGGGLDLIVMPGVAFDPDMGRLGHGAGFYDSYLARLCAVENRKPFLVGLCLADQFLPTGQIPMQETDWRVDAVAVGDGRLVASSST